MNSCFFKNRRDKLALLFFDVFFLLCSLFFIVLYFDKFSSFVKTLFAVLNIEHWENSFLAFSIVSLYFVVFLLFLFFLYKIVISISGKIFGVDEKYFPLVIKKYFLCFVLLICFFFLSFVIGQKFIHSSHKYDEYISCTKNIIDKLNKEQSFTNVNIYVEHVPYLFEDKYNIKTQVLPLNYLNSEASDNIIFTDSSNNYYLLNYQGYSYIKISDKLSIYTNSKKVIKFLFEIGYEIKPYYVYSEEIDFAESAKLNNITLDQNGFITLDNNNPEVTIPPFPLYAGNYQFDFDFELIECSDNDSDIFAIESSFDFGKTDYQLVSINRKEFTDNRLVKTIKKSIPSKQGLMFRIVLSSNSHLLVKHFTITKY